VKPNPNLGLWLDFAKAIIISGLVACVIAIVPAWINYQNRKAELDIAEKKADAEIKRAKLNQDKEDVNTFLAHATDLNVEKRYRLAEFAKEVSLDEKLREGWKELFKISYGERNAIQEDLKDRIAKLETLSAEDKKKSEVEIQRLKGELTRQSDRGRAA